MGIDILGIDIMGVDILGIDILALPLLIITTKPARETVVRKIDCPDITSTVYNTLSNKQINYDQVILLIC